MGENPPEEERGRGGEGGEGCQSWESKGTLFIMPSEVYLSGSQGLRCQQSLPPSPDSHPRDRQKTRPEIDKAARAVACGLLAREAVCRSLFPSLSTSLPTSRWCRKCAAALPLTQCRIRMRSPEGRASALRFPLALFFFFFFSQKGSSIKISTCSRSIVTVLEVASAYLTFVSCLKSLPAIQLKRRSVCNVADCLNWFSG